MKEYLSPYYCKSLRIPPWWRRGRVSAHISGSKLGASIHPEGGKKIQVGSRSACHVLRERKYLWLILRLMICLEDSCRLWLYTGRCEMEGAACYRVSGSSRVIRACSEVTKLQEGKDQNRTLALAPLRNQGVGFEWKRVLLGRSHGLLQGFYLFCLVLGCTAVLIFMKLGAKVKLTKEPITSFAAFQNQCNFSKVTHLLI